MKQPESLIAALLCKDADVAGRDDAAMDLGVFDEPEVEQALVKVGSDPKTDPTVAASCGESLAEIWRRQNRLPEELLLNLRAEALTEIAGYIRYFRSYGTFAAHDAQT